MITATPDTLLGDVCEAVDGLEPGQALTFSHVMMRGIPEFHHNDARFNPADRVLENIVGSSMTHSYSVDPLTGNVSFYRHVDTGQRRYQSPDRR